MDMIYKLLKKFPLKTNNHFIIHYKNILNAIQEKDLGNFKKNVILSYDYIIKIEKLVQPYFIKSQNTVYQNMQLFINKECDVKRTREQREKESKEGKGEEDVVEGEPEKKRRKIGEEKEKEKDLPYIVKELEEKDKEGKMEKKKIEHMLMEYDKFKDKYDSFIKTNIDNVFVYSNWIRNILNKSLHTKEYLSRLQNIMLGKINNYIEKNHNVVENYINIVFYVGSTRTIYTSSSMKKIYTPISYIIFEMAKSSDTIDVLEMKQIIDVEIDEDDDEIDDDTLLMTEFMTESLINMINAIKQRYLILRKKIFKKKKKYTPLKQEIKLPYWKEKILLRKLSIDYRVINKEKKSEMITILSKLGFAYTKIVKSKTKKIEKMGIRLLDEWFYDKTLYFLLQYSVFSLKDITPIDYVEDYKFVLLSQRYIHLMYWVSRGIPKTGEGSNLYTYRKVFDVTFGTFNRMPKKIFKTNLILAYRKKSKTYQKPIGFLFYEEYIMNTTKLRFFSIYKKKYKEDFIKAYHHYVYKSDYYVDIIQPYKSQQSFFKDIGYRWILDKKECHMYKIIFDEYNWVTVINVIKILKEKENEYKTCKDSLRSPML
jgi:hypothetical protein